MLMPRRFYHGAMLFHHVYQLAQGAGAESDTVRNPDGGIQPELRFRMAAQCMNVDRLARAALVGKE